MDISGDDISNTENDDIISWLTLSEVGLMIVLFVIWVCCLQVRSVGDSVPLEKEGGEGDSEVCIVMLLDYGIMLVLARIWKLVPVLLAIQCLLMILM